MNIHEIIVDKRSIEILTELPHKKKIRYGDRILTISNHLWNRLNSIESRYLKLIVIGDKVISVNSKNYRLLDNKMLWSYTRKLIPLGWRELYSKVDDFLLITRYEIPVEIGFQTRVLYMLLNINDGKTSVKVYYGFYVPYYMNGILVEEISLVFARKHTSSSGIILYEITKSIKNWKKYVNRLEIKKKISTRKIQLAKAISFVNALYKKRYILRRHLDEMITELKRMTTITLWDLANVITFPIEKDNDFKKNIYRWVKIERTAGRLISDPNFIETF